MEYVKKKCVDETLVWHGAIVLLHVAESLQRTKYPKRLAHLQTRQILGQ